MTSYYELLKHPKWQRKRLEILQMWNFSCSKCESTENTLHVHHKHYVKGRKPWEYSANELTVLCESCHKSEHEAKDILNMLISHLGGRGPASVKGIADFLYHFLQADYFMKDQSEVTQDFFLMQLPEEFDNQSDMAALGFFFTTLLQDMDEGVIKRMSNFEMSKQDLRDIFIGMAVNFSPFNTPELVSSILEVEVNG
ncbi:HNH endonuclease [Acinetobacter baumannii]|uniref:HNH endonuclease n=1 Tax=Acinetobacter baumannii TaxID=470 RepID=UPI0038924237